MNDPRRGQVFDVAVPGAGRKPFVVVSNNERNRVLDTVLVVRITTAPKPRVPTIVEIGAGEPVVGRALCDFVAVTSKGRLARARGALSQRTMRAIDESLRMALAL